MRKATILFLFCYCCFYAAQGQINKKKIYQFHSINSLALVNGNNAVSAAIQTVNGFSKGPLFAGIGLGLDYYQYRTIPVFADVRYELGKRRNKFFVYGDAGINCSWVQEYYNDWPSPWERNRSNNFNNGFYSDAGIGLNAGFKNGNAFILSLGYSRKTMEEKITYDDWRTGDPVTDINTYRFNRVILKAGFRF
jgi:hypothetical protein